MSVSEGNLVCPKCQGKTMVKDSRPNQAGTTIRRRRECFDCRNRFTTFEITMEESLTARGVRNVLATAREAMRNLETATKDASAILDAIEKTQSVLSGELAR